MTVFVHISPRSLDCSFILSCLFPKIVTESKKMSKLSNDVGFITRMGEKMCSGSSQPLWVLGIHGMAPGVQLNPSRYIPWRKLFSLFIKRLVLSYFWGRSTISLKLKKIIQNALLKKTQYFQLTKADLGKSIIQNGCSVWLVLHGVVIIGKLTFSYEFHH